MIKISETPKSLTPEPGETPVKPARQPIGPLKRGRKVNPGSAAQTKPWEELKISKRTWYRMGKP